jgi:hypothetical protein
MGVEKGGKDDAAIGRPQVSGVGPLGESVIGGLHCCAGALEVTVPYQTYYLNTKITVENDHQYGLMLAEHNSFLLASSCTHYAIKQRL